jgi:hypothetical protein
MLSQGFVYISRAAAFRGITGDIPEFTFSEAGRAFFRKRFRFQNVTALPAFPERLPAFRAGIIIKRCLGFKSANRAFFDCHITASLKLKFTAAVMRI